LLSETIKSSYAKNWFNIVADHRIFEGQWVAPKSRIGGLLAVDSDLHEQLDNEVGDIFVKMHLFDRVSKNDIL
jgi:hypothetical protein